MKYLDGFSPAEAVSEMAIVDTLTKLIFGQETGFSDLEVAIIRTLRAVDANVSVDSHSEMGGYLRALGVREMIGLVAQVRGSFGVHPVAFGGRQPPPVQRGVH